MFEFQTIERPIEDILLKEKGSKFIGFAYPVNSESDIKQSLNQLKSIHPKATHHCYAFRLGINGENYRANDDGEPSGSAGLPIYNQLLAHQITNILVVVIRYYGGTKLGVGGLVKAYKESAKYTLEQANIVTKELESKIELKFKFSQQNLIFTLLNKYDAKIISFEAEDICTIKASFKTSKKESISDDLSEMLLEFNFS
ncbi:putative YigZ family protein [Epilithonimonas hungarica]|uniref:IMPACT family protein n=1 Tax=Epilithonimonas hungarica TaxID=454006 RepID=UPI002780F41D|nr:YigZ family protein [Epilithonimonas hungarica]MDP9957962.1 putative YigZ family protein [Epilithonimonas hungarica]